MIIIMVVAGMWTVIVMVLVLLLLLLVVVVMVVVVVVVIIVAAKLCRGGLCRAVRSLQASSEPRNALLIMPVLAAGQPPRD